MRTDANNLVTTASTTHLPEQKETIHMIHMLRKEARSGNMQDLGHVRTEDCLSDCLTKHSAKPDNLLKAILTGFLPNVDAQPLFRELVKHKAYFVAWFQKWFPHRVVRSSFQVDPTGQRRMSVAFTSTFLDLDLYADDAQWERQLRE